MSNPYGGYGQPPMGQAPPPYGGGPMMQVPPLTPGVITERNSAMVVVLSIVTCGLYGVWWVYKTSEELKTLTGDTSINPALDAVVSFFTCFLWAWFTEYRAAQKVHQLLAARQPTRKDQSQLIILLNVGSMIVGVAWIAALFLTQEELNQLARAANGR